MSAIAITRADKEIILLSDGRQASEATREVEALDKPKVWKINDHTGLLWLGYYPFKHVQDILLTMLQKSEATNPAEFAEEAARFMKRILTPQRRKKLQGTGRLRFCILVMGYADDGAVILQLDSENEDMFRPKRFPLPPGQSAVMGYNKQASDGRKYQQLLTKYAGSGLPAHRVCKSAFQEFINDLEAAGVPVGGEIFCETLQPKKKSAFRQALMN